MIQAPGVCDLPGDALVLVVLGPAHHHSWLRHFRRDGAFLPARLAGFAARLYRQRNLPLRRDAAGYPLRRRLRLSRRFAGGQNPALRRRARPLAGARFHLDCRIALAADGPALASAIRGLALIAVIPSCGRRFSGRRHNPACPAHWRRRAAYCRHARQR